MNWRHPRLLAGAFALVFFPLAVWVGTRQPFGTALDSSLSTVFAFLGGSGFTAWLSMTIYEHITREGQNRSWEREFKVELVREVYGPIHDELRRNLELLEAHLSKVKWNSHVILQRHYLSLLAPKPLIELGDNFARAAHRFNELHDRVMGGLDELVRSAANEYIESIHGPPEAIKRTSGAEARCILGATDPALRKAYGEGFLTPFVEICKENQLDDSTGRLEAHLKKSLLDDSRAQEILSGKARLTRLARKILDLIDPMIEAPYSLD